MKSPVMWLPSEQSNQLINILNCTLPHLADSKSVKTTLLNPPLQNCVIMPLQNSPSILFLIHAPWQNFSASTLLHTNSLHACSALLQSVRFVPALTYAGDHKPSVLPETNRSSKQHHVGLSSPVVVWFRKPQKS